MVIVEQSLGANVKPIGLRVIQWSAVALVISIAVNFLPSNLLAVLGPLAPLLSNLGSIALFGIIFGLTLYPTRVEGSRWNMQPRTAMWIGIPLIVLGVGLPAWFLWVTFNVPGSADAIFIVMILAPIGLLMLVAGAVLLFKNLRK